MGLLAYPRPFVSRWDINCLVGPRGLWNTLCFFSQIAPLFRYGSQFVRFSTKDDSQSMDLITVYIHINEHSVGCVVNFYVSICYFVVLNAHFKNVT